MASRPARYAFPGQPFRLLHGLRELRAIRGPLPAGSFGLGYSFGRYGLVSEVSTGGQLLASRSSRFYDESVANRRSTVSLLFRYQMAGAGPLVTDILGGAALVTSDTRGFDRVTDTEVPLGGRHPIVSRRYVPGYRVGADVAFAVRPRWSLRIPVRFTYTSNGKDEFHPGSFDTGGRWLPVSTLATRGSSAGRAGARRHAARRRARPPRP